MRLSEEQLSQMLKGSHAKIRDNITVPAPNRKPVIGNELAGEKKIKRFDGQVSIRIRSYRHRLADPFAASEKFAIDAIVDRGILFDDSCKEISEKESSHEQIKIKKKEAEKTIIVIESVE